MKTTIVLKTVLIIKIMPPYHQTPQNSKETVFILEDNIENKLSDFLLTRKLNHKCLVKIQPFSSVKVRCMHDHLKPTAQEFNLDFSILHYRTNDLNSERKPSQINRSITKLVLSLKSQDNKKCIFLNISSKLNNKACEVNSCLFYMCAE